MRQGCIISSVAHRASGSRCTSGRAARPGVVHETKGTVLEQESPLFLEVLLYSETQKVRDSKKGESSEVAVRGRGLEETG